MERTAGIKLSKVVKSIGIIYLQLLSPLVCKELLNEIRPTALQKDGLKGVAQKECRSRLSTYKSPKVIVILVWVFLRQSHFSPG